MSPPPLHRMMAGLAGPGRHRLQAIVGHGESGEAGAAEVGHRNEPGIYSCSGGNILDTGNHWITLNGERIPFFGVMQTSILPRRCGCSAFRAAVRQRTAVANGWPALASASHGCVCATRGASLVSYFPKEQKRCRDMLHGFVAPANRLAGRRFELSSSPSRPRRCGGVRITPGLRGHREFHPQTHDVPLSFILLPVSVGHEYEYW